MKAFQELSQVSHCEIMIIKLIMMTIGLVTAMTITTTMREIRNIVGYTGYFYSKTKAVFRSIDFQSYFLKYTENLFQLI